MRGHIKSNIQLLIFLSKPLIIRVLNNLSRLLKSVTCSCLQLRSLGATFDFSPRSAELIVFCFVDILY